LSTSSRKEKSIRGGGEEGGSQKWESTSPKRRKENQGSIGGSAVVNLIRKGEAPAEERIFWVGGGRWGRAFFTRGRRHLLLTDKKERRGKK